MLTSEGGTSEVITITPYDSIVPTGWLTAYGRTFSDIPYSQAIFDELEAIRLRQDTASVFAKMKDTKLAPQFEARYKLINKLIKATGIHQIIEIASGLSSRGLELTGEESTDYVEVDLPVMAADKRKILDELRQKSLIPVRQNLQIQGGNALDLDSLLHATSSFDPSDPLVVVNEGLLRYLTFDERARYATNVAQLLKQFGGVWITSDVDISLDNGPLKRPSFIPGRRQWLTQLTGRDIAANLFKDEDEAMQFFTNLGFDIDAHSHLEVIEELSSPAKLVMPRDYVEAVIGSSAVFAMTLRAEEN